MSSQPTDPSRHTDSTSGWEAIADCVDRYMAAYEQDPLAAQVGQFLPVGHEELQRQALIELVKVDLDLRQAARQLESYLAEFSLLNPLPPELIWEEFQARKRQGQVVPWSEYEARFPLQAHSPAVNRMRQLGETKIPPSLEISARSGRPKNPLAEIHAGQALDDFELLTLLGQGAFAKVFLARQRSIPRLVALKVSASRGQEPQTLARLEHPSIVRVYDQRSVPGRGVHLLYMEYVAGTDLKCALEYVSGVPPANRRGAHLLDAIEKLVRDRGEILHVDDETRRKWAPLAWPRVVCQIGCRLALALAEAHRQKVLHRDIKPANVLLGVHVVPKLADFNVSYADGSDQATAATHFGGSLAYMSPEQLASSDSQSGVRPETLGPSSDIYSLGIMLVELLIGERPFSEAKLPNDFTAAARELLKRRQAGVPDSVIAQLRQVASPELAETLLACLDVEPTARPATAARLAQRLTWSLDPDIEQSLSTPRGRLAGWISQHPLWAMVIAGVLPNAVLSPINLTYNWPAVFENVNPIAREHMTKWALVPLNVLIYGACVALGGALALYLVRMLNESAAGASVEAARLDRGRRRSLWLADGLALICLAGWLFSCVAFSLQLGSALPAQEFIHFAVSQTLFGLLAATTVFAVESFLAVRFWYPALLKRSLGPPREPAALSKLGTRAWMYQAASGVVPFLAVVMLATTEQRWGVSFRFIGIASMLCFVMTFPIFLMLHRAIERLARGTRFIREFWNLGPAEPASHALAPESTV